MFYYMLFNHYQSTTETYNIFITTIILYWICFMNISVVYRFNILLGLIAIDIGLYTLGQNKTLKPLNLLNPSNPSKPIKRKKQKKVRFSNNIGYRYLPPVQKQEDFLPNYMTYGRKPEKNQSEVIQPIDNQQEYEEIMSQDNTSVLSSFANSFADSNSSNSF